MFRFEEDAFLRKGGEYSRNCLAYDEEEELASKLSLDGVNQELPRSIPKARTVFVSAGGKCTEAFVRSMIPDPAKWSTSEIGIVGIENDEVSAFLCPSDRRPAKEPLAKGVDLERRIALWLLADCSKETTIVIFTTCPAREQTDDFLLRKLANPFAKDSTKILNLEQGRLVDSFAATLLEQATLRSIPAICYIAPREPVLSRETMDLLAEMVVKSPVFDSVKDTILKSRKEWTSAAIRSDERDLRRFEPEGMFM